MYRTIHTSNFKPNRLPSLNLQVLLLLLVYRTLQPPENHNYNKLRGAAAPGARRRLFWKKWLVQGRKNNNKFQNQVQL